MPYSPMQLAEAFIQTGELTDALDALNQQLAADSTDNAARRLRIGVLLRLSDDDYLRRALVDFDALGNLSAEDEMQRSVILERLGDLDGALEAMERALTLKPDESRLIERRLHLLIAHNKIDVALELVHAQPRVWHWLQWEGDLLVMSGDDMMATARYGLALAQLNERYGTEDRFIIPIRARLLLTRGNAYRRLGDAIQAEKHYLAAGKLIPTDPMIPFNRGLLAMQRGLLSNALELCRKGFREASDSLKQEMLSSLQQDAQYAELGRRLVEDT